MHITTQNVNTAFRTLVTGMMSGDIPSKDSSSRNGPVRQVVEPVIVTYTHPKERVLFNAARDCNPFFHLYESLWMLAGRNDVSPLSYYNGRIGQFSDDGNTFNGAYGYRWRHADTSAMERDQLEILVEHLKDNPGSRRAVLQMWNVEDDLLNISESKDVCCNTHTYFSISDGQLDMTVCNRSNDMIWGMLGANAVHFSILQEYLAAHIGVGVGVYHQFTNNLHVYIDRRDWQPERWLDYYESDQEVEYVPACHTVPLVQSPTTFDRELPELVERHNDGNGLAGQYAEPFLQDVAQPMMIAFHHYKRKELQDALIATERIEADDWRTAAREWIERRVLRQRSASGGKPLQAW